MREIKFKAWDKRDKRWVDDEPFWIIGETTMFDLLKQYALGRLNDLEMVQYTGIKDRTGCDIFEGDILERRVHVPGQESNPEYWPRIDRSKVEMKIMEFENASSVYGWNIATDVNDYEVIGNIYENPELLDDEAREKIK